jgi:hypothetical protein
MEFQRHRSDLILNPLRHVKHGIARVVRNSLLSFFEAILKRNLQSTVASGPFRGMHYDGQHVFGAPMAKLLGTYEMELHSRLFSLLERGFGRLINVGGAEGYYAIGIARNWRVREVIVFELSPRGQEIISKLARENGVTESISINGKCSEQHLYEILSEKSGDLLIIDVEGDEIELLTQRVIGKACKSTFVVEAHDFVLPGCTERLRERLEGSHHVQIVYSQERTIADFPCDIRIPGRAKLRFMNEGRPGRMSWVIASPREGAV